MDADQAKLMSDLDQFWAKLTDECAKQPIEVIHALSTMLKDLSPSLTTAAFLEPTTRRTILRLASAALAEVVQRAYIDRAGGG